MKIPLRFPHESKEFRRGLDLPRRGESKAHESSKKSPSNRPIAVRSFWRERGGGGEKERLLGHPAVGPIYTQTARAG